MRPLDVGERFDGRYVVRGRLGAGGFATVYLAESTEFGDVALKVLSPDRGDSYDPATRIRFDRETQILRTLRSPSTVRLLDAGLSQDGYLFLVTEHIEGTDLSTHISGRGRLSAEETVLIARQILRALGEAHRAGLIHRDIKPENIRITPAPEGVRAVLLDFGIARSTDDSHPQVTMTGELLGTPRYMSPEQLTEKPLTAGSDIYSLGLVMFEMLAGRQALQGNRLADQIERLRTGHLLGLPDGVFEPALFGIIQRMTARHPEHRLASAEAVLAQLERLGPDAPPGAPAPREAPPRRIGLLVVAAIVATALVAAVALEHQDSPPPPPASKRTAPSKPRPQPRDPPAPIVVAESADVGHDVDRSRGCGRPAPLTTEHPTKTPRRYDSDVPHALVIAFHQDYVLPQQWLQNATMRRLADEEGVIIVAPDGVIRDGVVPRAKAWRDQDAIEVARWVRDRAFAEFCIDPSRVYVIGHADGVRASKAVGCEPWVAAVAHVGDAINEEETRPSCTGLRPAIWLHTSGSPRVPDVTGPTCTEKPHLGRADTEQLLRTWFGCESEPVLWPAQKGRTCRTHCDRLAFCHVRGGATWPGETQAQEDALLLHGDCWGDRSPEFDILDDIWKFFSAHEIEASGGKD